MKIWTYGEMRDKVEKDLDLEDEIFIKPDEMVGYFNEALNEATSEIMALHEDYFLTKAYLPLVEGVSLYDLPYNIYANKIRSIIYSNGSEQYRVERYRRKDKFLKIALADEFTANDYYRYILTNDVPGQSKIELHPAARDNAVLFPTASLFAPMVLHYIRNCARVPILGELCNPETIYSSQVNSTNDTLQTYAGVTGAAVGIPQRAVAGAFPGSIAIVLGDKVRLEAGPGSTLPDPLTEKTDYYAVPTSGGLIKLATSRANAFAGTTVDLTDVGTGYFILWVAATQNIIDATLIDIPEFSTFVMQWVKCRCLEKEGDPRLGDAAKILVQQKKQMIETLENSVEDDDDEIQADTSFYEDMS